MKIEPTHDGYWLAILPVTEKPTSYGLMFGSRYENDPRILASFRS